VVAPSVLTHADEESYLRKHVARNISLTNSLSDAELPIHEKNCYFHPYEKDAVWPVTNFTDTYPPMPEFKDDPVMQRLRSLYIALDDYIHNVLGHLPQEKEYRHNLVRERIEDASISLCELATQMGNRSMNEETYISLFKNYHPSLITTYNLMERLHLGIPVRAIRN